MAADGRATDETDIFSNKIQKIHILKDGSIIGVAGDLDIRDFITLLNKSKTKLPSQKALMELGYDFTAILVKPDQTAWLIECGKKDHKEQSFAQMLSITHPFYAVGSGSKYAMGAMDQGASAEQAVKIAIKYDSSCGGSIQVYKLEQEEQ